MKLYHIKAKNKFKLSSESSEVQKDLNKRYDALIAEDYNETLPFRTEPTVTEVVDVLKLLKPTKEFYIESVDIKYVRDLKQNEL